MGAVELNDEDYEYGVLYEDQGEQTTMWYVDPEMPKALKEWRPDWYTLIRRPKVNWEMVE